LRGFLTDSLEERLAEFQGFPFLSAGKENHEFVTGIADREAVFPSYFPE
jgi:hypothetical protein